MKKQKISIGLSGVSFSHIHAINKADINDFFNKVMKEADSIIAFHFTPK